MERQVTSGNEGMDGMEEAMKAVVQKIGDEELPYSDDPGAQYWAHFRMRVMERIEETESRQAPWYVRARDWFGVSWIRPAITGFTAAAAIAGVMLLGPQPNSPVDQASVDTHQSVAQTQIAQQPTVTEPNAIAQVTTPDNAAATHAEHSPSLAVASTNSAKHNNAEKKQGASAIVASTNVASAKVSTAGISPDDELAVLVPEADELEQLASRGAQVAISMEAMSQGELESVLEDIQGM